jgi:hypothetical protein
MNPITIPGELKSIFGVAQPTTVCDEQGNVLGYYTPAREVSDADYEWLMNDVSEAEIEFSLKSGPGRPFAEIIAELRRKHGP